MSDVNLGKLLSGLTHYHVVHTDDTISKFTNDNVVIYITTDPAWIKKLEEVTKEAFDGGEIEKVYVDVDGNDGDDDAGNMHLN